MKRILHVLTLVCATFSVLNAQPYELEEISWLESWRGFNDIALKDDTIAVVTNSWGLLTFDMSNPAEIELLDYIVIPESWNSMDIQVEGNIVVLPNSTSLIRLDISNPRDIIRLPPLLDDYIVRYGVQYGEYFYAKVDHDLLTFDVSNPLEPAIIDTLPDFPGSGLYLQDDLLIGGWPNGGILRFVSIENPEAPEIIGEYALDEGDYFPYSYGKLRITFNDLIFQIVRHNYVPGYYLQCIDISEPSEPEFRFETEISGNWELRDEIRNNLLIAGEFEDGWGLRLFSVHEDLDGFNEEIDFNVGAEEYCYAGDLIFGAAYTRLIAYDISNLRNPQFLGEYPQSYANWSFIKAENYLAHGYSNNSIRLIDVSDPSNPRAVDSLSFDFNLYPVTSWQDSLGNHYLVCTPSTYDIPLKFNIIRIADGNLHPVSEVEIEFDKDEDETWYGATVEAWNGGFVVTGNITSSHNESVAGHLWVISLLNPDAPEIIGQLEEHQGISWPIFSSEYQVEGDYIYMPSGDFYFIDERSYVISLVDPSNPEIVQFNRDNPFEAPIAVQDDVMYAGREIYSLENPAEPELVGNLEPWRYTYSKMNVDRNLLSQVDRDDQNLKIYNIDQPYSPEFIYSMEIPQMPGIIHLENGILYTLDDAGLHILRLNGWNGIENSAGTVPSGFLLHDVYPNPFNSSTVISYSLPSPGFASLNLFDLSGRQVRTLSDGFTNSGEHRQILNATDIPSGSYFLQLNADGKTASRKVTLVR